MDVQNNKDFFSCLHGNCLTCERMTSFGCSRKGECEHCIARLTKYCSVCVRGQNEKVCHMAEKGQT